MIHVQYDYLKCSIAQAQANRGIYRSKVAQRAELIPVHRFGLRKLFSLDAAKKALKALRRHGENSYQFRHAMRSRWINGW